MQKNNGRLHYLKISDPTLPLLSIDRVATRAAIKARFGNVVACCKANPGMDIPYGSLASILNGYYRPVLSEDVQGSGYQTILHKLKVLGVLVEKEQALDQAA
jgi:hypothetical protein